MTEQQINNVEEQIKKIRQIESDFDVEVQSNTFECKGSFQPLRELIHEYSLKRNIEIGLLAGMLREYSLIILINDGPV